MGLRLWYLRRVMPWSAVSGCLAVAVALLGVTLWKDTTVYAVLPLVALLSAAAAAVTVDDAASAVTSTTARGSRWAASTRLAGAAGVALVGMGLLAAAPEDLGRDMAWLLVVGSLVLAVTATSAWLLRRGHTRPGAAVASGLVLIGILPFMASRLLGTAWPWPSPGLDDAMRGRWLLVAAVAAVALGWTLLRPVPHRVGTGRRPPHAG
jgi:hypothetical protein